MRGEVEERGRKGEEGRLTCAAATAAASLCVAFSSSATASCFFAFVASSSPTASAAERSVSWLICTHVTKERSARAALSCGEGGGEGSREGRGGEQRGGEERAGEAGEERGGEERGEERGEKERGEGEGKGEEPSQPVWCRLGWRRLRAMAHQPAHGRISLGERRLMRGARRVGLAAQRRLEAATCLRLLGQPRRRRLGRRRRSAARLHAHTHHAHTLKAVDSRRWNRGCGIEERWKGAVDWDGARQGNLGLRLTTRSRDASAARASS